MKTGNLPQLYYISAIRAVLKEDGIHLNENKFLLTSLTKACRLNKDRVQIRLPIQKGMINLIINSTKDIFLDEKNQPFLASLYCALFSTAYFGLFRIGELTSGTHPVLARDVHIGQNKRKMAFILRLSKTHNKGMFPQSVKISSVAQNGKINTVNCPYEILRWYLRLRPGYKSDEEPFFVFSDRSPVTPDNLRKVLKTVLIRNNLDSSLYKFHGIRSGRAVDLLGKNFSVETIKKIGRWKTNIVFQYLK